MTLSSFSLSAEAKATACTYMPLIVEQAESAGFDPGLIASLIYVESRFEKDAASKGNACGLMQLIPKWNKEKVEGRLKQYSCKELMSPELNIRLGIIALKRWVRIARKDTDRALCGYNAGTKCIKRVVINSNSKYILKDPSNFRYVKAVRRTQRRIDRRLRKIIGN